MIFKYHSKGQGDVIIGGWVSIVHNWIYIFIKTPHPEKWMLCTIILKQAIIKKKLNAWIQEWLNQVWLKLTILEKKIKSETLKTVPGMTAIEKCWSEKHTYIISSIFVAILTHFWLNCA